MRQMFFLTATLLTLVWCQPDAIAALQDTTDLLKSSQVLETGSQLPIVDQLAAATKKKGRKACPAGQNRDPETGTCFSCSHNDHFDTSLGKCVPCKPGFHEEVQKNDNGEKHSVCLTDKKKSKKPKANSCPEGRILHDGNCEEGDFNDIAQ